MSSLSNRERMAPRANTNAVASGQDRPRWTHVLPAPVRSLGRSFLHKWQYLQYLYGALSAKIKQALAKTAWTVSKPIARTGWGQSILEKIVVLAQYLQGIGCGGDVFSTGEAGTPPRADRSGSLERAACALYAGGKKRPILHL